jgi:hypothetical protein
MVAEVRDKLTKFVLLMPLASLDLVKDVKIRRETRDA